jgi:hypothetical protein
MTDRITWDPERWRAWRRDHPGIPRRREVVGHRLDGSPIPLKPWGTVRFGAARFWPPPPPPRYNALYSPPRPDVFPPPPPPWRDASDFPRPDASDFPWPDEIP